MERISLDERSDAGANAGASASALGARVGKQVSLEVLLELRRTWRERRLRVVWTNGCFDVVHAGHVASLRAAAALGDRLVVGLNSDASVRRRKGATRPVFRLADRLAVLEAFEMVDQVLVFESDTAEELVAAVEPDVFCKGQDYAGVDTLPEAAIVRAYGGAVELLPLVPDLSTTSTLARLRGAQ